MIVITVAALLIAGGLVLALTPLIRETALRRGWVDLPDEERKLHTRIVPRLGGVAIAGGIGAGGLFLVAGGARPTSDLWALFGGAAVLWVVGLWDDLYGVGFKRKFFFQILAAYGLLLAGWRLDLTPLPVVGTLDLYDQALLAVPFSLVWLVGVVNAMNFTDGKDGLAGGVAMIAFLALGCLALFQHQLELAGFCLVASAALAGFLVYNWNPASIFMGDSGSLLLGFLLGGVALRVADAATTPLGLVAPLGVLGLPVLDTLSCMARRVLAGKSPFAPDADHIHHRMVRAAGSVRLGVLVLYAVTALYGGLSVLVGTVGGWAAEAALGAMLVLSYLLLRQLSYLRARVVLRQLQRRWGHHRRAVRAGDRLPLRKSLIAPPPAHVTHADDGLRLMQEARAAASMQAKVGEGSLAG